jgi:hypothetical protein
VDRHAQPQVVAERVVVARVIDEGIDDGAAEEDVAVGVGDRADPAHPSDVRSLRRVEPDHKAWYRCLGDQGEPELPGREAALDRLQDVGEEIQR